LWWVGLFHRLPPERPPPPVVERSSTLDEEEVVVVDSGTVAKESVDQSLPLDRQRKGKLLLLL